MQHEKLANNGEALLIWVKFGSKLNLRKKSMGNTVGRLSKASQLAYIAGFLDGDGSIMLQMHRRQQVDLMLEIILKLQDKSLTKEKTVVWIEKMRNYNYFSSQRTVLVDVPVTTDI